MDEPRWMAVDHRCHGCEEIETKRASIPAGERGIHVYLAPYTTDDDGDS